ncbi:MAG: extracellular solute-binding protein [Succinivibrio sp.]|nr:extracellular solute-binding protein [Succinivibrio sp.]
MNKFSRGLMLSLALIYSHETLATEKLIVWEDVGRASTIATAVKDFETIYDCKVEVREKPMYHQVELLEKQGPKGEGPDVVVLASDMVGVAKDKNLITPVHFMQVETNQYLPNSIASVTFDGELYSVPKTIETLIVFYNKDLLPDPPETLEEYVDLSKKMRKKGKYGLLAKWDLFYTTYALMHGYGAYIFRTDNDGTINLNSYGLDTPGAVESLKVLRKMSNNDLVYDYLSGIDGYNRMYELFTSKKALAVINGPWAIEDYLKAGINFGITTLPNLPNGNPMAGFLGTKGYSISKWSTHKELAEDFLRFLNEHKYALLRYKESRQIPPIISVLQDPSLANDDLIQVIAQQSVQAVNMPSIPEMSYVWSAMDKAIWKVTHTETPIDYILENTKKDIESDIQTRLKNN